MIFCPHIDTLYRFLSICIIYAYLSYMCTDFTRHRPPCCEGENRSLYLVTQTTAARGESQGRWREQEHTVGKRLGCQRFKQSCRKKKTPIDHCLHSRVNNGIYSSSIHMRTHCVSLRVIKAHKSPKVKLGVQSSCLQLWDQAPRL